MKKQTIKKLLQKNNPVVLEIGTSTGKIPWLFSESLPILSYIVLNQTPVV